MRLLTHNQLLCIVKGCKDNFPLLIKPKANGVSQENTDVNPAFIKHIMGKVHYGALYAAATQLGLKGLPAELPANWEKDEKIAKELIPILHKVLLDTHVDDGALVCSKCGRQYPIQQGIPNMRLNEDEV